MPFASIGLVASKGKMKLGLHSGLWGLGFPNMRSLGGPLLVDTRIVVGKSRVHFQDSRCCFFFVCFVFSVLGWGGWGGCCKGPSQGDSCKLR